eukprot:TRINITY_DN22893_c0_g1_i1.p1 TRINITY_DN22893_c0_g1~~TRINITY_DN22893_c0_g1_i1.p1  ORF type:complete len:183 (+),score=20.14 TRINITY_DN22893_c0_g1_i1:33-551(+)
MANLGVISANGSLPTLVVTQQPPVQTRAALAFLFSEQGDFFREFILDEVVKGIDAVSREQLGRFVVSTGIYRLNPLLSVVPLPGTTRSISLIPTVTSEDEKVITNMKRVVKFLSAGTPAAKSLTQGGGGLEIFDVARELLPVLPNVASKVLPEIINRLTSRIIARTLRELFL